jgi:ubiquinone/menaquinone biosynthesis C-methylase UbiE
VIETLLTPKSISPDTIGPFYLGESNRPASSRGEAVKSTLRQICPPVVWAGLRSIKKSLFDSRIRGTRILRLEDPDTQDLEVYWDPEMAATLETWGIGTVWHEHRFLMAGLRGRVLDIACGTGRNIQELSEFPNLEVHGCDISDLLIGKAIERGILQDRLRVCDATRTGYGDKFFDYSYSIGSFEHFTEKGLQEVIAEAYRITRRASFHMVPVSKSGRDEGWIKIKQSYWCNSVDWWMRKYKASFQTVAALDSFWKGEVTNGKWFICVKDV